MTQTDWAVVISSCLSMVLFFFLGLGYVQSAYEAYKAHGMGLLLLITGCVIAIIITAAVIFGQITVVLRVLD